MAVDARVVTAAARSWLRTPYRHAQSVRGYGCDCLGLLIGVYREVVGDPRTDVPPYGPSWHELPTPESGPDGPMYEAAQRFLIGAPEALPGGVVLFRMRAGALVKHCGILTDAMTLVHARSNQGVVEVSFGASLRERAHSFFEFPG